MFHRIKPDPDARQQLYGDTDTFEDKLTQKQYRDKYIEISQLFSYKIL